MSTKVLVTAQTVEAKQQVHASGCEVLAEYPDTVLARCDDAQLAKLEAAGLEVAPLPEPRVQVSGLAFSMKSAVAADAARPLAVDESRPAYYLVQPVGPVRADWLQALEGLGATLQATLAGSTLLVGVLPAMVPELQALPWVESVSSYRPAMKVSPRLAAVAGPVAPAAADLEAIKVAPGAAPAGEQVEIGVFKGESTAGVADRVRASGGAVLSESPGRVVAVVPPDAIVDLAAQPEVLSIVPHHFPKFTNDKAAVIMTLPADAIFSGAALRGAGQLVAVADSGLDTGALATLHPDIAVRVDAIESLPLPPWLEPYVTDAPGYNDGAADSFIGHGTHVVGSALSDGQSGPAAGVTYVPAGVAPEARLYFQAIELALHFKTNAQMIADHIPFPPGWPWPSDSLWGLPDDIRDLFAPAYAAGARIHTNSWGSADDGLYSAWSGWLDDFMWQHRDMLVLFSAGNEGDAGAAVRPGSINTPATAKNCLTVGASENNRPHGSSPTPGWDGNWALAAAGHVSDNIEGMAHFSSRGPCDDQRIKPDVVAPGTNILSLRSSTWAPSTTFPEILWGDLANTDPLYRCYCWSGGTSMSTPLVAGLAALVRQHLVQVRGHVQDGVKPSGALIKAMIVNGAVHMAGQYAGEISATYPNNSCGFGRVSAADTLAPGALEQTLFADDPDYAVATGEMRVFEVQPLAVGQPLRVTLAWTDAPSPEGAGGLQNSLYLQVVEPGGAILNGDLTAYPTAQNNVQQVWIEAPVAGTYQIRVRGISVTYDAPAAAGPGIRQDFALVVSGAMGFSLQPVSIAQTIDTTGSMDYFGYIEPARERATQLVDFLRANDKVSVTEFSERPGVALARTPCPLRLLASFDPDWTAAHTAIDGLHADGNTPIGEGLAEAWNQLAGESITRPRAIVLLSDGYNNRPRRPEDVLPLIPAEVPIYAIALGPASNSTQLQDIANSRPGGGYFAVESDEDIHKLHEIYAQVQALAGGSGLVGLASAALKGKSEAKHQVTVDYRAPEVTFALSWEEGGGIEGFGLTAIDPEGRHHSGTGAGASLRQGRTYRLLTMAAPKPGEWTLVVGNLGSASDVRYTLSAALPSALSLTCDAKPAPDRLTLAAHLLLNGKPWSDAKVIAHITYPTVSRADILAKCDDEIARIEVPENVYEKGYDEEQLLNLRLSLFGLQHRGQPDGLYQRKTADVPLAWDATAGNGGAWVADLPLAAAGKVDIVVDATGELDAHPWQRTATRSVELGSGILPEPKFAISGLFVRRSLLWKYVIIGVRVERDGRPASPADGIEVHAAVKQAAGGIKSGPLPYYKPGRYFIWRLPLNQITRKRSKVAAEVTLGGAIIASAETVLQL